MHECGLLPLHAAADDDVCVLLCVRDIVYMRVCCCLAWPHAADMEHCLLLCAFTLRGAGLPPSPDPHCWPDAASQWL